MILLIFFSDNLILAPKVPRYAYGIMSNKIPPKRNQNFWRVHLKIFVIKEMRSGNKFIVVTLNAPSRLNSDPFILDYSIKQLPSIVFFIKLEEGIPHFASFVMGLRNCSCLL